MLLSASDIIRRSFSLCRDNGKLCLEYMAIFFVIYILQYLFSLVALPAEITASSSLTPAVRSVTLLLVVLLAAIADFILTIALTQVLAARYLNQNAEPLNTASKRALKICLPVLWVAILTALIVSGGFVLLIVPGIIFAVWFGFSTYATILDNHRGVAALKCSRGLVRGRWGGVFWRLFAPGLLFGILLVLLQGALSLAWNYMYPGAAEAAGALTVASIGLSIISAVITTLFTPLLIAAPTILYLELKKTPAVK